MSEAKDDAKDVGEGETPESSGSGCILVIAAVVLSALVLVPLGFASKKFLRAIEVVSALRTLAADEASHGPKRIVVRGKVSSTATNGPNRPGAAAWIGEVGRWERRGKSSTYVIDCTVTRVDGMVVRSGNDAYTIAGFDGHAYSLAHGLAVDPGRVAVDFFTEPTFSGVMPPDVGKVCELRGGPSGYRYNERIARLDDEVTVRGCLDGTVLRACGDGVDFVTLRGAVDIVHDTKDEIGPSLLGGSALALLGLGVLALVGGVNLVGNKKKESYS